MRQDHIASSEVEAVVAVHHCEYCLNDAIIELDELQSVPYSFSAAFGFSYIFIGIKISDNHQSVSSFSNTVSPLLGLDYIETVDEDDSKKILSSF